MCSLHCCFFHDQAPETKESTNHVVQNWRHITTHDNDGSVDCLSLSSRWIIKKGDKIIRWLGMRVRRCNDRELDLSHPLMLSSNPPDDFDENSHFTLQNEGVVGLWLPCFCVFDIAHTTASSKKSNLWNSASLFHSEQSSMQNYEESCYWLCLSNNMWNKWNTVFYPIIFPAQKMMPDGGGTNTQI